MGGGNLLKEAYEEFEVLRKAGGRMDRRVETEIWSGSGAR
jgi:hypothetical protein